MTNGVVAGLRPRDRQALIQSLSTGVVPKIGLQHIQVGRVREVEALMIDIGAIADGGAAVRFVIGEYGAGKTFFLNLIRLIALEKRLVTIHADLGPDRRLHASGGQAKSLYSETIRNMATRNKPDGGGLTNVLERFLSEAAETSRKNGTPVGDIVRQRLARIRELVGGFDFAEVIAAYWSGSESGNDELCTNAMRWLRGEFATRTDARAALGIRTFVDDTNVYDHWKLMAEFVRLAGYAGLFVVLDEMVNLYKLQNAQARNSNYEQLLRIVNDALQGSASGIGFVFAGTPDFLLDSRRGVYSYPALQSRLQENIFAQDGAVDLSGPIIRLQSLTPEDLHVLLEKVRLVFANGDQSKFLVPDDALPAFMAHCDQRIGNAYFRTPRTVVKAFVQLLSILEQNPSFNWRDLLLKVEPEPDRRQETNAIGPDDDELSSFRL